MDNRATLEALFSSERLALNRSDLFDTVPPPLPPGRLPDRVEGMLLGLAIGDSLGNTTEGQTPARRQAGVGVVSDYLPNRYADGRQVGVPSDDTQLAFWTLEQLLEDGGLVADDLARRFCQQQIFGIGSTVRAFLGRYKDLGLPWDEAGTASAGNGALMRIAPILIPHVRRPSPALWADTAIAAMITHNDPSSTGSCLALIRLLWEALGRDTPPEPSWWVDTFCQTLEPLERHTSYGTRVPDLPYRGPLWRFVQTEVPRALAEQLSAREACDRWYSGAFLLETVPSVLYILACHAHDPEEAIVRAVNDTKDNDTIAAVVGAVVGALHGRSRLPERWVRGLLGRTGADDDGRVFELIQQALGRFVSAA